MLRPLIRFFLPRRKENFLNVALFALLCCICVFAVSKLRLADQLDNVLNGRSRGGGGRSHEHGSNDKLPGDQVPLHVVPDYSQPRSGPGEAGAPVHLSGSEEKRAQELMKKWFFNIIASDKISLDRSIPDTRNKECKSVSYDYDKLPNASVVIIFHNEAWTPLLRTVHSVYNRSPPKLLHEIVLLDDASDREELGEKLERYLLRFPKNKIKLVRKKERQGLIRARLEGAKAATGEILVFLDSHCESNVGWLEPLVYRIYQRRSAIVCPVIDFISDRTIEYRGAAEVKVGGFSWWLLFKWAEFHPDDRKFRKSELQPLMLEPLAQRIREKRTAVLCPTIDIINDHTMTYWGAPASSVGGFWWSLHFKWVAMSLEVRSSRKSDLEPLRLEPIAARIKESRSAILCPMIDAISDWTMSYPDYQGDVQVGGFTWSLFFTWMPIQQSERGKSVTQPVKSPTMAGGLFAADRKYFFEVGGYDPGMDIWGGENLEISFRVWMCGGSLEFIPCSRVGHIFRAGHPYNMTTKDVHGINSARLAEVWMDDYKRLYYKYRRDLQHADIGDISERVALRKRLNCKSFKWFLDNVYPEKFIPDENVYAFGMIKNPQTGLCLDTMQRDEKSVMNIGVYHCQNGASSAQVFSLSKKWEIRREENCADSMGGDGGKVSLASCHGREGNQKWSHKKNGQVVHEPTGKCLDVAGLHAGDDVVVRPCSDGVTTQQWTFETYLDL